jgi:hypothetical protein
MNQQEIDELVRQILTAPATPNPNADMNDDAARQEYFDRIAAQITSSPHANIPMPDFGGPAMPQDEELDPYAGTWPASGAPRTPRR